MPEPALVGSGIGSSVAAAGASSVGAGVAVAQADITSANMISKLSRSQTDFLVRFIFTPPNYLLVLKYLVSDGII
jgi:hypothetical protein